MKKNVTTLSVKGVFAGEILRKYFLIRFSEYSMKKKPLRGRCNGAPHFAVSGVSPPLILLPLGRDNKKM